jgi:hypothetical protein
MYNDDGYSLIQRQKEFEEWLRWYEEEDYKFQHTD